MTHRRFWARGGIDVGVAAFAVVLLAACPSQTPERERPGAEAITAPSPLEDLVPIEAEFVATIVSRSAIDGDEQQSERDVSVGVALDFSSADLAVFAIVDGLETRLEVRPGGFAIVDSGLRSTLLTPDFGEGEAPSHALTTNAPIPQTATRAMQRVGECVEATLTLTWPEAGPLAAVARVETFRFCPNRGLVSRRRLTTFPLGSRSQEWTRS